MKKTVIKLLSLVCTLTMILGVFVGCATKTETKTQDSSETKTTVENKKEETKEETKTDKKEFANKELEVAAFQGGFGKEYWESVVQKFETAYPGVKVNLTINPKLGEIIRPKVVAGNPPDFLYLSIEDKSGVVGSLIKENGLLELTDVFNEKALDKDITLKENILSGFLETAKCSPYGDNKIYLAPFYYNPMGLVYNKAHFTQKGYEIPKTWDDFFALGEVAKSDGRSLFTYQGIYPGYLEIMLWPALGMDTMNKVFNYEEGSFSSENVKKVLTNIADISKKGYMMNGTVALNHTQSQTDMMLGKALFIPNGNWMEGEMKDAPREDGFEFGIAPAPVLTANDKVYAWTGIETLSIPSKAKNPELAKEFLKFMYTDESVKLNAEKSKGILPVKDGLKLAEPFVTKTTMNFFEMFDKNVLPMIPNWKALPSGSKINVNQEVFDKPVTKVMNGEMTVEEWIADVEKAFKQIREEAK